MTTYEDTIAFLLGLEGARGWDLKLDRVRAAMALCGAPERAFASIHVAGTNGKGSTAAMIESVLRRAGYRTGLYTSPHLVDLCERVRAGGATIPRDAVVRLVARCRDRLAGAGIELTHFELVTLMAFLWLAEVEVDVAVIEVGLGGRLDATNVVTPVAGVITSIARDHEAFLGTALSAIAGEKAGIAKPDVPLVLGPAIPSEADATIRARAAAVGAPIVPCGTLRRVRDGDTFDGPGGCRWTGLQPALRGEHQRQNAATALTTLAVVREPFPVSEEAVAAGLAHVSWPGRLTVVRRDPLVVVDGAHNPAGARALAQALPEVLGGRRVTLVFAIMADKDWRDVLAPLLPFTDALVVTRVGRRALEPQVLADALRGRVAVRCDDDPRRAIADTVARMPAGGAVLVAGSLFLVGEAYPALDGPERRLFPEWQGWNASVRGAPR